MAVIIKTEFIFKSMLNKGLSVNNAVWDNFLNKQVGTDDYAICGGDDNLIKEAQKITPHCPSIYTYAVCVITHEVLTRNQLDMASIWVSTKCIYTCVRPCGQIERVLFFFFNKVAEMMEIVLSLKALFKVIIKTSFCVQF